MRGEEQTGTAMNGDSDIMDSKEAKSGLPNRTQALYARAKRRIPGGTQLLSKRPEMFAPGLWPAYFERAEGCAVWDLDGRRYDDFSHNGVGACLLGYAHPAVSEKVKARIDAGTTCTLNPPEEVELADRLCAIHPWAAHVRLGRCGGEACAMAVRIARATTGRSRVLFCGYHGWHDWYLAANLGEDDALAGHLLPGLDPAGVPRELRGTAGTFPYNDREAFDRAVEEAGENLAAVIMEPCRYRPPEAGFLEHVRARTHTRGALLIFDEITIGWRLCFGGAHLLLGVEPDLAVFAKALGNGHPIAAVIGTEAAMAGAHDTFISSSNWTEGVGPVAALATLEAMEESKVWDHAARIGGLVQGLWRDGAARFGLPIAVPESYPCLGHFAFEHPLANELRTVFTQLILEEGFLAGPAFYPTLAHTEEIVSRYGQALERVLPMLASALAEGRVEEMMQGPPAHEGFRRLL